VLEHLTRFLESIVLLDALYVVKDVLAWADQDESVLKSDTVAELHLPTAARRLSSSKVDLAFGLSQVTQSCSAHHSSVCCSPSPVSQRD
jgi:hypothetical protein